MRATVLRLMGLAAARSACRFAQIYRASPCRSLRYGRYFQSKRFWQSKAYVRECTLLCDKGCEVGGGRTESPGTRSRARDCNSGPRLDANKAGRPISGRTSNEAACLGDRRRTLACPTPPGGSRQCSIWRGVHHLAYLYPAGEYHAVLYAVEHHEQLRELVGRVVGDLRSRRAISARLSYVRMSRTFFMRNCN